MQPLMPNRSLIAFDIGILLRLYRLDMLDTDVVLFSLLQQLAANCPEPEKMTTKAVIKFAQERAGTVKAVFEPLETQITRSWSNHPQLSRDRAFLISEIAGACRGRFRERPRIARCSSNPEDDGLDLAEGLA